MYSIKNIIFVVLTFIVIGTTNSARILSIFHTPSKSHQILSQQLLLELNKAGHEITLISPFPIKNPPKNWTNVPLTGVESSYDDYWDDIFDRVADQEDYFKMIDEFFNFPKLMTDMTLQHPNVRKLLESNEKFDLLFIEVFLNDAFLGFAHHYNCPVVAMSTIGMTPWAADLVGAAAPMSFVPNVLLPYKDKMNLKERLHNIFVSLYERYGLYTKYLPDQEEIYEIAFANPKPSLIELRKTKVSLVLINSHFSISFPRPYLPNMVDVAGMQVNQNPPELPADIKKFIENAEHGVVYFSMGSNIPPSKMSNEKRTAILNAFGKIKQKVIWKWDDESLSVDTNKFLIKKWLPQDSVLAHPNVKLFITHGGLLSCTESVFFGVPMLGVPIFGDQMANMGNVQREGWGIWIDYRNLTESSLTWALDEVLKNPKYTKTVKKSQQLLLDQPLSPIETAKFWVEYVIRHKGAPHIKSMAPQLSVVEFYNIDAYAILLCGFGLIVFILTKIVRKLLSIVMGSKEKVKKN